MKLDYSIDDIDKSMATILKHSDKEIQNQAIGINLEDLMIRKSGGRRIT